MTFAIVKNKSCQSLGWNFTRPVALNDLSGLQTRRPERVMRFHQVLGSWRCLGDAQEEGVTIDCWIKKKYVCPCFQFQRDNLQLVEHKFDVWGRASANLLKPVILFGYNWLSICSRIVIRTLCIYWMKNHKGSNWPISMPFLGGSLRVASLETRLRRKWSRQWNKSLWLILTCSRLIRQQVTSNYLLSCNKAMNIDCWISIGR